MMDQGATVGRESSRVRRSESVTSVTSERSEQGGAAGMMPALK
jgi:hypothetical protein